MKKPEINPKLNRNPKDLGENVKHIKKIQPQKSKPLAKESNPELTLGCVPKGSF